jgi:hypothetical protein
MGENAPKPTINPEKWKVFLAEISGGLSTRGACGLAGLDRRAVDRAMEADPDLSRQFARARGSVEKEYLKNLKAAEANCDVSKWTWLLSHKFPGDYTENGNLKQFAELCESLMAALKEERSKAEPQKGAENG